MTSLERILAALEGKKTDRPAWVPLCSPRYFFSLPDYIKKFPPDWQGNMWPARHGDLEEELKYRVDFLHNLGADFMTWGESGGVQSDNFRMRSEHPADGIEVTQQRKGNTIINETKTPVGTLREVIGWHVDAFTSYVIEHAIKTKDDIRTMEYVLEHTVVEPEYETTRRCMEIIGNAGTPFVGFPGSPMMKWLMADFTVDSMNYALMDYPDEMASLEAKQHEHNLKICRILADDPGEVYMTMAVWGTAMVSPRQVKQHYTPYIKEYVDILRGAGKHVLFHESGEPVGSITDDFLTTGATGLYGCRQFSAQDAPNVIELKELWGDDIVVCGGIDPDFLQRASVQEIHDTACRILEKMADKPRFILGTVDDTSYETPPENLEAVSKAVSKFSG